MRTPHRLNRRQFVQTPLGLGLTMLPLPLLPGCARLPVPAPAPPKVARIGMLTTGSRTDTAPLFGLLAALADLGYVEGRNLALEARYGASEAQLSTLAAELVQSHVDLLLAVGTPATRAAMAATATLPIVSLSIDPVDTGLVQSLARPGGNVTGMTGYTPELTGKKLQLLRECVPGASRIAYLANPDNPNDAPQERGLAAAAQTLGVALQRLDVREPAALDPAVQTAAEGRAEALLVLTDSLVLNPQVARIAQLALQRGLPTMCSGRQSVVAGCLAAYGSSLAGRNRTVAALIAKLLQGAKPAELPIEGPTTFDFVINLQTAQTLGLTIPQSVLAQATEVIQ